MINTFVQIRLGNPELECRRYGICRMEDIGTQQPIFAEKPAPNTCIGRLNICSDNNVINLCLWKQSMTLATFDKYFANGIFRIETDTPFFIAQVGAIIAKGNYEITTTQDYIMLHLAIYDMHLEAEKRA